MLLTTFPGVGEMKPGSTGASLPNVSADMVDVCESPVGAGGAGCLVANKPSPGMMRTLYRNDERSIDEYRWEYSQVDSDDSADWVYFPGNGAKLDEDSYITVVGCIDDVLSLSGHRLGTTEIEGVIVSVKGAIANELSDTLTLRTFEIVETIRDNVQG